MAYVQTLFDKNFIEYASYVIRDRAIPDLEDGLKPVQRRIMHTLFTLDDGRMHKVAGVVGECMKYHPHGDASIEGALVGLASREILIARQGNFGNAYTGDAASAARYIECAAHPLARHLFASPRVTRYVPSYDGRSTEPVAFRAKVPLVLLGGAEGIAVGMSTKILPYNIREVLEAERAALGGKEFELFPDCVRGGLIDVTDYNDGNGKLVTRAVLDTSDEKRIVITELPLETTSRELLESIDAACKAGRVRISSVEDFTTDRARIELRLPRGVYAVDAARELYAYTSCEKTINCQMLVIKDGIPTRMRGAEVVRYYAERLKEIIKDELEDERGTLREDLHRRTLERIFVEERIYRAIEQKKTAATVARAVRDGFLPFKNELVREITADDIESLLKIPIRRISLFDINKNREQVRAINARLREIEKRLAHLTDSAVEYIDGVLEELKKYAALDPKENRAAINPALLVRQTKITKFKAVDVKEIARRDMPLRYDDKGYLGTVVSGGEEVLRCAPYDRILVVRKSGMWSVCDVPERLFVGDGMRYCALADKEALARVLFTIIYRDPKTKYCFAKRTRIAAWIMKRDYSFTPEGMEVLHVDTRARFKFTLNYVVTDGKPKAKLNKQTFKAEDFPVRSLKAGGLRCAAREVESVTVEGAAAQGAGDSAV